MADPIFKTTLDLPTAGAITDEEILEIVQNGESRKALLSLLKKFNKYNLAIETSTGVLDLSSAQVFRIDNSATTAKTISFTNAPADRAMTVVVRIIGSKGVITWPADITWNDNLPPVLGTTLTTVCLLWDGLSWSGAQSITKS